MTSSAVTAARRRHSRDDVLVDPQWLEDHLHDPQVRILEVDVSTAAFDAGHLPGATLWSIYRDLKDADYRLRDDAAIATLLATAGITPTTTVVAYGYAPAMACWLLKLYGHADARILDASREAWQAQGRPWTTEVSEPQPATHPLPQQDPTVRALQADVVEAIGSATSILDVRTDAEFSGERFWPSGATEEGGRAGHIPGATHTPLDGIFDENGCYVSEADLRRIFGDVVDGSNDVITYCAIGGRASTAWFALTYLLGRDNVRVYDGSWAEWGLDLTTPIALP
jgi:thiosulfate/3-mercaptopyruvate sulfurtransferase